MLLIGSNPIIPCSPATHAWEASPCPPEAKLESDPPHAIAHRARLPTTTAISCRDIVRHVYAQSATMSISFLICPTIARLSGLNDNDCSYFRTIFCLRGLLRTWADRSKLKSPILAKTQPAALL